MAAIVGVCGAAVSHSAQLVADSARRNLDVAQETLFAPKGDVLRVVSLDQHMLVADILWMRSVLEFGSRYGQENDARWAEWFSRSIRAVTALDPHWRTPYVYGGIMLKVVGASDVSTEIFELGAQQLPDDYYLPFAAGMNYYLDGEHPEKAAEWLEIASKRPNAPQWYAMAAVAFREKRYERQQAIHYLRDEIEATEDPHLREQLQTRLDGLVHDEIASKFDEAVERYVGLRGEAPRRVEDLLDAHLINSVPEDPMGESWVIDLDGHVRSTVVARELAAKDLRFERRMLTASR